MAQELWHDAIHSKGTAEALAYAQSTLAERWKFVEGMQDPLQWLYKHKVLHLPPMFALPCEISPFALCRKRLARPPRRFFSARSWVSSRVMDVGDDVLSNEWVFALQKRSGVLGDVCGGHVLWETGAGSRNHWKGLC